MACPLPDVRRLAPGRRGSKLGGKLATRGRTLRESAQIGGSADDVEGVAQARARWPVPTPTCVVRLLVGGVRAGGNPRGRLSHGGARGGGKAGGVSGEPLFWPPEGGPPGGGAGGGG